MSQRMINVAHDPGDAQITSHCPFCGSGQIVGRSDGNIECEFCGMTYLVRVQPMFTGMPGNPAGGGFGGDSSMAPDLMAPEAIGPDGEPVMGEPGMEQTPGMQMADDAMMMGGGPTVPGGPGAMMDPGALGPEGDGEPDEEEGDADSDENPFAGSGSEDDAEASGDAKKKPSGKKGDSKPPKSKKDKGNKKEGARLYSTIAGDRLPEDAYIRHLAALHGGPAVLRTIAINSGRCKFMRADDNEPCSGFTTKDASGRWHHDDRALDSDHDPQPAWAAGDYDRWKQAQAVRRAS